MANFEAVGENSLEVVLPNRTRRLVQINSSPFLIGRGDETGNHLPLADQRISRQCAAIVSGPEGCRLEDLGYRRGIFVNGRKINHYLLEDGDVITFGLEASYEIVFRARHVRKSIESMLTLIGGIVDTDGPTTGLGKLNLLLEATSLLHSDLPLDSVLGTMLDHAISITQADRGLLLEADPSGALRVRLARGRGGVILPTEGVAPSQTALRQALAKRLSVITEDLSLADTALKAAESIVTQSLRAIVAIPLYSVSRTKPGDSAPAHGHFLGVVYLDSHRPTAFSTLDRQILDALAVEAGSILDNARLVERERQRQRLEQELDIARNIQQALLPHGFHDYRYFAVTGIHMPCDAVGGDYFDVFPVSGDRTAFLVADVSGKGLGAALVTTMLQGALSGMATGSDPVLVFHHINRFLCEHAEVERYATLFFGILNHDGQLVFINAGHPSPLLLHGDEVTELVAVGSFPVGLIREANFTATTVNLEPSDTLVLFTDGVTEAMDPQEQLFGISRLRDALSGQNAVSLGDLQRKILAAVQTFSRGARQADDLTLLLLRYSAAAIGATS